MTKFTTLIQRIARGACPFCDDPLTLPDHATMAEIFDTLSAHFRAWHLTDGTILRLRHYVIVWGVGGLLLLMSLGIAWGW